jgi:hypothetical protein
MHRLDYSAWVTKHPVVASELDRALADLEQRAKRLVDEINSSPKRGARGRRLEVVEAELAEIRSLIKASQSSSNGAVSRRP